MVKVFNVPLFHDTFHQWINHFIRAESFQREVSIPRRSSLCWCGLPGRWSAQPDRWRRGRRWGGTRTSPSPAAEAPARWTQPPGSIPARQIPADQGRNHMNHRRQLLLWGKERLPWQAIKHWASVHQWMDGVLMLVHYRNPYLPLIKCIATVCILRHVGHYTV